MARLQEQGRALKKLTNEAVRLTSKLLTLEGKVRRREGRGEGGREGDGGL